MYINPFDYARGIALALHQKHYRDVVNWKPLDDIIGIMTQIDNMTCGLTKPLSHTDAPTEDKK